MQPQEKPLSSDFEEKVRKSFCSNLLKAAYVSNFKDTGEPTKITQDELSRVSGIARSTINKYFAGKEANPDLKTICKLAAALNISPATLLMTEDDWLHLANAFNSGIKVLTDPESRQLIEELGSKINSPADRAESIIKLSERAGYRSSATHYLTNPADRKIMRGILGTAAIPFHNSLKGDAYLVLLTMCVVMGARFIDQGNET